MIWIVKLQSPRSSNNYRISYVLKMEGLVFKLFCSSFWFFEAFLYFDFPNSGGAIHECRISFLIRFVICDFSFIEAKIFLFTAYLYWLYWLYWLFWLFIDLAWLFSLVRIMTLLFCELVTILDKFSEIFDFWTRRGLITSSSLSKLIFTSWKSIKIPEIIKKILFWLFVFLYSSGFVDFKFIRFWGLYIFVWWFTVIGCDMFLIFLEFSSALIPFEKWSIDLFSTCLLMVFGYNGVIFTLFIIRFWIFDRLLACEFSVFFSIGFAKWDFAWFVRSWAAKFIDLSVSRLFEIKDFFLTSKFSDLFVIFSGCETSVIIL